MKFLEKRSAMVIVFITLIMPVQSYAGYNQLFNFYEQRVTLYCNEKEFDSATSLATKVMEENGKSYNKEQRENAIIVASYVLDCVASEGLHKNVKQLLEIGANPNISFYKDGRPPLLRVAINACYTEPTATINHYTVLEELIKNGANLDRRDAYGDTVLHILPYHEGNFNKYYSNISRVIRLLVKSGCNINAIGQSGNPETPIMDAIFGDNVEAVKTFIDLGADLTIRSGNNNQTPLEYARTLVGETSILMKDVYPNRRNILDLVENASR